MNLISEARTALQTAEQRLKSLMEDAIQSRRYTEVAQLAEMAQALNQIDKAPKGSQSKLSPPTQGMPNTATQLVHPARRNQQRKSKSMGIKFPKFERDDNRLVKVGWSKREKSEYEHKAPRDIALCVYLRFGEAGSSGAFRMEDLLPINMADGSEIPSYQSYLVLAWLRRRGQVEKLDKDSYQWTAEETNESSFKKAWESTPLRTTQIRGKRND